MVRNIRERIGSLLPATVTSSELVSDTVPVIHAGAMGLQIWGAFVGQSAGEAMWDEMDPQDLAVRLKAFEMNRLLAVDGGIVGPYGAVTGLDAAEGSGPHSADPGAPVADRLEDLPAPTRALPEGAEPVESAELVDDELDELLEEY